jgi:hypothetical protein
MCTVGEIGNLSTPVAPAVCTTIRIMLGLSRLRIELPYDYNRDHSE